MISANRRLSSLVRLTKVFLCRWGILVLSAILLTWYLQYRYYGNDIDKTWQFLDNHALTFWYTVLIMFSILAFCYGIFRGPFKSIAILFGLITIIGYINATKFAFRGAPLLPEDFGMSDQAGTLTKFIDIGSLVRTIIAVLLAISLGFLLDYLTQKYLHYLPTLPKLKKKRRKTKKAKKAYYELLRKKIFYIVMPRIIIVPLSILLFIHVSGPILNHGGQKEEFIPEYGLHFISWSQAENYDENGFLIGFMYNIKKQSMKVPESYDKSNLAKIHSEYSGTKITSSKSSSLKDINYNIVIILDESFYDPSIISEYYTIEGEDATPNLHRLQKEYPSGYMYSPDYGGGTANIEFEVLTGLSNYWANTVPYTDILTKIPDITSLGKDAKAASYKTTAIHSFTGEMYKRQIALEKEGFEQFITEDQMSHTEKEGSGDYIKDSELYQEILDQLDRTTEKSLIFAITMQNHAPYAYGKYPHEDYQFWVPRIADDFDRHANVLSYLQTLYNSDKYLGEFLDNLEKSDEKTVVLFFGDHAPGVFPDVHDNEDKAVSDLSHLTPYFIWSNFDLGKKETKDPSVEETKSDESQSSEKNTKVSSKNAEDFVKNFNIPESFKDVAKNITLPITTPNCLTNTLYNVLSIKKDALQNLLDQVCTKTPILAPTYLGANPPSTEKVFKEYELLNYDILGGKQYWLSL